MHDDCGKDDGEQCQLRAHCCIDSSVAHRCALPEFFRSLLKALVTHLTRAVDPQPAVQVAMMALCSTYDQEFVTQVRPLHCNFDYGEADARRDREC